MPKSSNPDLGTSLIRTIVPIITGLIISGLLQLGIEVEPGTISLAVDAIVTAGWYTLIRVFEDRFPSLGMLLGSKKPPHYSQADPG